MFPVAERVCVCETVRVHTADSRIQSEYSASLEADFPLRGNDLAYEFPSVSAKSRSLPACTQTGAMLSSFFLSTSDSHVILLPLGEFLKTVREFVWRK